MFIIGNTLLSEIMIHIHTNSISIKYAILRIG